MHARIARFEGDPGSIDEMIDGIRKDVESGALAAGARGRDGPDGHGRPQHRSEPRHHVLR